MAFERISQNLQRLNENIRSLAQSSADYYKLDLFNKTMKGATAAVKYSAVVFFILFAILFLSIAVSVALSTWLEIPSVGFFIVGGLYLLTGLIILLFGGGIISKVMLSAASKKVFQEPEKKPKESHPEFTSQTNFRNDEIIIKEEDERV